MADQTTCDVASSSEAGGTMDGRTGYQEGADVPEGGPPPVPRDRCREMLENVALLSNGLNIGLNVGLLGPSLPDLALQTGSTIPDMSIIFIFSSIAYMLGSLACGLMLGRFEGYLLISLTLILQAATTAVAAWCTSLTLVTIFISLSYFFSTVIIAGTAYLCFRLERTRARVMTQSVFLLFNLGKAVVPFVLAPFLAPDAVSMVPQQPTTPRPRTWRDLFEDLLGRDKKPHQTDIGLEAANVETYIGYGYAIVAGFSLLMSILYMVVAAKNGCRLWVSPEERAKHTADDEKTANMSATTSRARKGAVLMAFFFMIFLQCGMESVDAGLLMTFLTEYLHRGKDMGVVANAVYQGVKVLACILVVLTVKYIHPSCLLIIDFLFMLASTVLMAVAIYFRVGDALLWTTFVLLAIGMSNSYATLASWLETRYRITGMVTSILTISFGLGSMFLPTLTTALLEAHGAIMFPLVLLGCSVLCVITYFITKVLMREVCCPRVDIGDPRVIEITSTANENQPLLAGTTKVAGGGTIVGETPQVVRSPRILKRQSLSELSPDQCFHAYHSRFINEPSAPSEYTLLYESTS